MPKPTLTTKRFQFAATLALVSLSFVTSAHADNWPQWRGPKGTGISTETGIAASWSQSENVKWKAAMPGQGGATPAVWDNRLFVTSADGDDLILICLNTENGKEHWRVKVTDGNQDARAGEGNSASPSPSTDGEHVWVFYSTGILACYDFDGNEVWKADVGERFGTIDIQFGMTSTPVLDGNHLYLQLIHGPMSFDNPAQTGKIVKLDKLSGETVWEVDRETKVVFECKHSYASPFIYDDGKQRFLVAHGADCTTGHSLESGAELWRFGNLNGPTDVNPKRHDPTFRFVASPGLADGKILIPTAKSGPLVALNVDEKLKGNANENAALTAWKLDETPDVSIPLIVGELAYILHTDGKLQCLEVATGKQVYIERTHTVQHRSSPVYADGKIYFCGKDGVCSVIKAGREFEILATNEMGGEPITASPVVANGTLYIRTYNAVYAIE